VLKRNFPAGKYEYGGMAVESTSKNFGTLDPQIDSTILDCGNSGLRNAGKLRQLALAQFLEVAQDPYRFSNRDLYTVFCWAKFFHLRSPVVVGRDMDNLNLQHVRNNSVDHAPLKPKPG